MHALFVLIVSFAENQMQKCTSFMLSSALNKETCFWVEDCRFFQLIGYLSH